MITRGGHENLEEERKIATGTTRLLERIQVDGPKVTWIVGDDNPGTAL